MNRKRSRWLAIGLLTTTILAGLAMAVTLLQFSTRPEGDLMASGAFSGASNLIVVVLGAFLLVGLEIRRGAVRGAARRREAAVGTL